MINSVAQAGGDGTRTIDELVRRGCVEYIPFPEDLRGKYQAFTQADLTQLRAAGYAAPFLSVEQGVARYCANLLSAQSA